MSVCHCNDCKRRTGSAFGAQARFADVDVTIHGESRTYTRIADSGGAVEQRFCGACGSTVYWRIAAAPGFTSIALGAFTDLEFPAPRISVYEERRMPWFGLACPIESLE